MTQFDLHTINNNQHPIRSTIKQRNMDASTSDHHPTVILNSLEVDDPMLPEKRVVNELDFFSREINSVVLDSSAISAAAAQIVLHDVNKWNGIHPHVVDTGLDLLGPSKKTKEHKLIVREEEEERSLSLTSLRAELERMNSENQRLKAMLNQVFDKYNTLKMHYANVLQHQHALKPENPQDNKMNEGLAATNKNKRKLGDDDNGQKEEHSHSSSEKIRNRDYYCNAAGASPSRMEGNAGEESPDVDKAAAADHHHAPSAAAKKARVSVRVPCEAPYCSDGCQWRKYGQKMSKGNPCPRAYYRCTMATTCPVRKQVQRCAQDRSVLIVTYEGEHNHPLPPAARQMASTTSAAATMLLSGASQSADGSVQLMNHDGSGAGVVFPSSFIPFSSNSSTAATISSLAPIPTITLDLTNSTTHQPPPLPQGFASAAAAALAGNPSFTAALVSAITSIMGGSNNAQPDGSDAINQNVNSSPRHSIESNVESKVL